MSGIVKSGRQSGHGSIDANDPGRESRANWVIFGRFNLCLLYGPLYAQDPHSPGGAIVGITGPFNVVALPLLDPN
jgi:hypothetical protein